jgi:hypothetical protein
MTPYSLVDSYEPATSFFSVEKQIKHKNSDKGKEKLRDREGTNLRKENAIKVLGLLTTRAHGVTFRKTATFTVADIIISNLTLKLLFIN